MINKPMKSFTIEDLTVDVKFPTLVSRKLDGVRMFVQDGVCLSSSGKQFPNPVVNEMFWREEYNGFDGEIIYGDARDENVCEATKSVVMSKNKTDFDPEKLNFWVFDVRDSEKSALARVDELVKRSLRLKRHENLHFLNKETVFDANQLLRLEAQFAEEGFEGIMVQYVHSLYKFGRSTKKEQCSGKFKRHEDDEFLIIGAQELMHNDNEATINEQGYTKRSSSKENKRGSGTLGTLVVRDLKGRFIDFEVGTGFDAATRQQLWDTRHELIGKAMVTVKWMAYGIKDAPRQPVFKGIRDMDF